MSKLIKSVLKFLSKILLETLIGRILLVLFLSTGVLCMKDNLLHFLKIPMQMPLWQCVSVLLLIAALFFLLSYWIRKPKKDAFSGKTKIFFYDHKGVSWKVKTNPLFGVNVEIMPYCTKCKVKYLEARDAYVGATFFCCPKCEERKDGLSKEVYHQAVKNLVEAGYKH